MWKKGCLAGLMFPVILLAEDRFVSPTGNDTAAGTATAPWKTVQKAANTARPGDVVTIKAGIYYEAVSINVSGTSALPVLFKSAPGESVILDGSKIQFKKGEAKSLISLVGKSYIAVEGLELRFLRTSVNEAVPMGLYVAGSGRGVAIRNLKIHHIEQNGTKSSGVDAHGLAVYGNSTAPIQDLEITGNEVSDCILGSSEALVVNGNVTAFEISGNTVHDCNNIGIDIIGYEGTCPDPAQDRARNGVVAGNTVYNIDTFYNPAYGGKAGKGGGERSAAGIYVDGGKGILIEGNHVFNNDFGVELASEWASGSTEDIVLRDNLIHNNLSAGLIMGGYDQKRGRTRRVRVANNTFYNNDRLKTWAGQITLQYFVSDLRVENNIFWAEPANRQILVHEPYGKKVSAGLKEIGANVVFDYNRFYCTSGSVTTVSFSLFKGGQQRTFTGLGAWQTSPYGLQADIHSGFGNPKFQTAVPPVPPAKPLASNLGAIAGAFVLAPDSPSVNTGNPATMPDADELDFYGGSRLTGAVVDQGADERP